MSGNEGQQNNKVWTILVVSQHAVKFSDVSQMLTFGSFHSLKGRSVNEASIQVMNWSKLHVCYPPSSPPYPLPSHHLLFLLPPPSYPSPYPHITFYSSFPLPLTLTSPLLLLPPSPLPSHHLLLLLPPPSYLCFTFYSSFTLPLTLASPFTPPSPSLLPSLHLLLLLPPPSYPRFTFYSLPLPLFSSPPPPPPPPPPPNFSLLFHSCVLY